MGCLFLFNRESRTFLLNEKITAEKAVNLMKSLDEKEKSRLTNKSIEEIGHDIANAFENLFTNTRRCNMSDASLQILYMVKNKEITPEEGEKLLDALQGNYKSINDNNAKFIKIKVTESNGNEKVNVTLPITFLSTGMKLAEKFSPEFRATGLSKSDLDDISTAVKSGELGKIIDVKKETGERVEISIE